MDQPLAQGAPVRRSFYYGWVILSICALTQTVSLGAGGASFSVFLKPMSSALGWSRTTFTAAVTAQTLGTLMVAPVIGTLLDRYGPRYLMAGCALVAGISYMLMGSVTEPWQFYILYTIAAALGLNELGNLVTTSTVSKWFVRMRGRALAVNSAGINLGQIFFAPLTAVLIATFGWRAAWPVLGVIVLVTIAPPALMFMRRLPEDMGLRPDGDLPIEAAPATPGSNAPARSAAIEPKWDLRSALKTPALWALVISNNLSSLAYGGVLYHLVAYYTDIGLSLRVASGVIALNHAVALVTKWPLGILSEHIPARYGLILTYGGRIVGLLFLLLSTSPLRVLGYVLVSGSLSHSIGMLQSKIWADYYGRAFIGTIRGTLMPLTLFSSLGGPIFSALVFDRAGSYNGAFWAFIVTLILSSIAVFFARPPGPAPNQREPVRSADASA